jgi:toxin ParE1/3/4
MPAGYDESEYVFRDLQNIYRFMREEDEALGRRFLEAAYHTFEVLAEDPLIGRPRPEFGHTDLRSWRVQGFRTHLIFYRPEGDRIQIWRVLQGSRDLHRHL